MLKRPAIELGEVSDGVASRTDAKRLKLSKTPEEIDQLNTQLSQAFDEYKPEDGDTQRFIEQKLKPLLEEGANPRVLEDLAYEHMKLLNHSDMLELMISYMDNVNEESNFLIIPAMSYEVRDNVIISAIKKHADAFEKSEDFGGSGEYSTNHTRQVKEWDVWQIS